jgi:hypothetical protein
MAMPPRPDIPCSACGVLTWSGSSSWTTRSPGGGWHYQLSDAVLEPTRLTPVTRKVITGVRGYRRVVVESRASSPRY